MEFRKTLLTIVLAVLLTLGLALPPTMAQGQPQPDPDASSATASAEATQDPTAQSQTPDAGDPTASPTGSGEPDPSQPPGPTPTSGPGTESPAGQDPSESGTPDSTESAEPSGTPSVEEPVAPSPEPDTSEDPEDVEEPQEEVIAAAEPTQTPQVQVTSVANALMPGGRDLLVNIEPNGPAWQYRLQRKTSKGWVTVGTYTASTRAGKRRHTNLPPGTYRALTVAFDQYAVGRSDAHRHDPPKPRIRVYESSQGNMTINVDPSSSRGRWQVRVHRVVGDRLSLVGRFWAGGTMSTTTLRVGDGRYRVGVKPQHGHANTRILTDFPDPAYSRPVVSMPSQWTGRMTNSEYCGWTTSWLNWHDISYGRVNMGVIYIGKWRVPFRARDYRLWNGHDATKSRIFHSGVWVLPLLQDDPDLAVELLLEQAAVRPDPFRNYDGGKYTSAQKNSLKPVGWSEGDVTIRTRATVCAYHATGDPRLRPLLQSLNHANMDPGRYYGPPHHALHNHGLRADQAMLRSGKILREQAPVIHAESRLRRASADYWSGCGMMQEQATSYQLYNTKLWQSLLPNLGSYTRGVVEQDISRAKSALGALLRPDRQLEAIGESYRDPRPVLPDGVSPGGRLWCPWEGGHGGWAAQHITRNDLTTHHIVRFGPPPRMHGTPDHGSATWFVDTDRGRTPVLSDPGRYDAAKDARYAWTHSPAGHSTFERRGYPIIGGTSGRTKSGSTKQNYVLTTANSTGLQARKLVFGKRAPVLVASDSYTPIGSYWGRGYSFRQHWILSPEWRPDGSDHTARNGKHTLDVICLADGKRYSPRRTWVEHFPKVRTAVRALEVSCTRSDTGSTRMTAVLVVDADNLRISNYGHDIRTGDARIQISRKDPRIIEIN